MLHLDFERGSSFVLTFNKELADVPWTLDSINSYGVYKFFSATWTDLNWLNTQRVDIAKSGGSSPYGNSTITIPLTIPVGTDASFQLKYVDPTNANDANALQDLSGNDSTNMVLGAWTNDNLSAVDATNFTTGKSVLVVGGQGNDTMTGGAANDTFAWFAGDAGTTGAVDVVKNFGSNSSSDKLDISKLLIGYTGGTNLSQWVTSITTAQTSPGGVSGSTKIVIDPDSTTGSGTATQTIWLEGVNLTLTGANLDAQLTALKTNGVLIA